MKIDSVKRVIMPDTHEIRYYFNGYITPEFIQDVKWNSFGSDLKYVGLLFMDQMTVQCSKLGDIEVDNDTERKYSV